MNAPSKVVQLAKQTLKRVVGTSELYAVGYGDVGSSIYYTLGAVALYALGATPLALMLAGLAFVCTALTYSELSTTFPESGGSASFARHAFNDLISFIAGWGLLLDYLLTLAISAFTIPPYLKHTFTLLGLEAYISGPMHTLIVVFIIVLLFVINLIGLKSSGKFSLILAIVTLITQLGVVFMGALLFLNIPYVIEHLKIAVTDAAWSPTWLNFWKGTSMAMVAYTGIEALSQMSGEAKNPAANIPRAIKYVINTVLFLYLGLSFVGLSVVSPQELGTKYLEDAVGGIAMNFPIGGEILGPWVGVTAAIILIICANAGLIGCSRLVFSLGTNYQIPKIFSSLHKRFKTPYVSLSIFALLAIALVIWCENQMLLLADLYNFGAQIAFFFAHLSLIVLRIKKPDLARPYKAPLNIPIGNNKSIPLTAVFGCLVNFVVWVMVVITKPEGRLVGLLWMLIGLSMYFIYRKKQKFEIAKSVEVEEIDVPEYKPLNPQNILVLVRLNTGTEGLQTALQLAYKSKSKLTCVYILQIPETLFLDGDFKVQEDRGELALKKAKAIALENKVEIDCQFIRARSISKALNELISKNGYDLVFVSSDRSDFSNPNYITRELNKSLSSLQCPVIFSRS